MHKNFKEQSIEFLNNRIEELKRKNKLTTNEKIELKQIEKELDKRVSPVTSAGVFVPDELKNNSIVQYIDIDKIIDNDFKDRSGIDPEKLKELEESIKEHGLFQPIAVIDNNDGTYTKVIGKRRILAHKNLGKKRIKAILFDGNTDSYNIKLAIIHENNNREELNMFDKVRVTLELIEDKLNISKDEAKTICTKIKNKNKLQNINEDLLAKENIILEVLNHVGIFKSISNLVNSFPVLEMSENLISALVKNKITYKVAETLHKYRNNNFKDNITIDKILENVIVNEFSKNETLSYIKELLVLPEDNKSSLNLLISSINKKSKKLSKQKIEDLELELKKLEEKYFS